MIYNNAEENKTGKNIDDVFLKMQSRFIFKMVYVESFYFFKKKNTYIPNHVREKSNVKNCKQTKGTIWNCKHNRK